MQSENDPGLIGADLSKSIGPQPSGSDDLSSLNNAALLQHMIGNAFVSNLLDAKLKTNRPGDKFEQQADRVAEHVVNIPESNIQRAPDEIKNSSQTDSSPGSDNQSQLMIGSGQPLTESERDFFNSRFGQSFSGVRVHTGGEAAEAAAAVNARAFTVGQDVVFGEGQYQPATAEGRKLLAHELAHTIQQNGAESAFAANGSQMEKTGNPIIQGNFFGDLWEGAKEVGGAIASGVSNLATGVVSGVASVASGAADVAGNLWEGVKGIGGSIWSGVKAAGGAIYEGLKAAGAWTAGIATAVGKWGLQVLKSAGEWIYDLVFELPERVWRLLQHVASGIVGVVSWVWDGIVGGFGHLWEGVKGIFSWAGRGVVGLFGWIWDGVKGGAQWAWKLLRGDFSGFWDGIGGFFSWLGDGIAGLARWGWDGLKAAAIWVRDGAVGVAKWLWAGLVSGAAWVGRFIAKLLDLIGFGEIMDLLWQLFKWNTREMTPSEIAEASTVFSASVDYSQVRIDEGSLIASLGAFFSGGGGMGVTTFHTINFNRKVSTSAGSSDMAWLIHELTHVSQMEHVGMQYMGEALHAQATTGYSYGGPAALTADRAAGKHYRDYNREQQADIAKHFYLAGASSAPYLPFIDELRRGEM